ncbi:MAG: hypothetical protein A2Y34_04435 [Spirochaetes bacterium GWC1_27_15]|nr:MAG: hypothetical protein A2Y34_04435 [Spirochaetes bacterium GWC1_27_15]
MINYHMSICRDCEREACCNYPCQEYSDQKRNQYKAQEAENIRKTIEWLNREEQNKVNERLGEMDMNVCDCDDSNDIENFLEYSVENVEWLRCINGQIPYTELIDKNALLSYLEECNERHCDQNGLCEVCRTPLVEAEESRGEHFGTSCGEVMWHCPNNCV